MPQLASDNFDRVDANDLGANWTTIFVEGEQIGITGNAAVHKHLNTGDACSSYSAISWPNDQYSEVACQAPTAGEGQGVGHGPAVRISTTGAVTLYRAVLSNFGGGTIEISKFVAGVYALLGTRTQAWTNGDILRLEIRSSSLSVYRNGVKLGTDIIDGSPIASGRAGVAYSSTSNDTNQMDNWAGGSLVTATVPSAPTGLSASPGDSQVVLNWTAPASDGGSAITGYNIFRGLSSGTETLVSPPPVGTSTAYYDFTAVNGTTYYYKVSARNAVGDSALSNEAFATPVAAISAQSIRTFKRFYGPTQIGNTAATLYTCPSNTQAVIRHIHVSNPSGSPVDFTLSIGTSAAATRLWDAIPMPADDVVDHYQDHNLSAGEIIQAFAGTAATLNLTIDGYEIASTVIPPSGPIYPSDTLFPSDISP